MKQHRGKITAGVAAAAVITGLILSTPKTETLTDEALRDSALVHATDLAMEFEGLRLDPYHDQAGYVTVGWGHKLSNEPWADLDQFDSISREHADSLLAVNMGAALDWVDSLVQYPLTFQQRAALADFVFNEGVGHFQRSTLLGDLNEGDFGAVPMELLRWKYAGHKINPGLERRREAEVALWLE